MYAVSKGLSQLVPRRLKGWIIGMSATGLGTHNSKLQGKVLGDNERLKLFFVST